MNAVMPFPGEALLWEDGDRISVGLSGSTLPKGMRVSVKTSTTVGQALLHEIRHLKLKQVTEQFSSLQIEQQGESIVLAGDEERVILTLRADRLVVVSDLVSTDVRNLLSWVKVINRVTEVLGWSKALISASEDQTLRSLLVLSKRPGVFVGTRGLVMNEGDDQHSVYLSDTKEGGIALVLQDTADDTIRLALQCREMLGRHTPIILDKAMTEVEAATWVSGDHSHLIGSLMLSRSDCRIDAVVRRVEGSVQVITRSRRVQAKIHMSKSDREVMLREAIRQDTEGDVAADESDRRVLTAAALAHFSLHGPFDKVTVVAPVKDDLTGNDELRQAVDSGQRLILDMGPVGSGTSETLWTLLRQLEREHGVKIVAKQD